MAAPIVLIGAQVAEASWVQQTVPLPSGATSGSLSGVACPSAASCVALGSADTGPSSSVDIAEGWDGTSWSLLASPPNPANDNLFGLSCSSATACTAVGRTASNDQPLAERWDGTSWTGQSVPSTAGGGILNAVSCPYPARCVAVGETTSVPVAETWNGTTWTEHDGTLVGREDTLFNAVSCTAGTACMAVGEAASSFVPVAERWNGHRWTLLAPLLPAGGTEGTFTGVSCSSATTCTAVGIYNDGTANTPNKALAESWNGTTWTVQTTAPLTSVTNILRSVSCTHAGACTAVGNQTGTGAGSRPLIEHWNGTAWVKQTSVIPPKAGYEFLLGVSCPVRGTCTSVGFAGHTSQTALSPLAEQNS